MKQKLYVLSVENLEDEGEAHVIKVYTDRLKALSYKDKLERAHEVTGQYDFTVEEVEVDGKPISFLCEGIEE